MAGSSGLSFSKLKESAVRLSSWHLSGVSKKSHHRSAGHHDADYRGRSSVSDWKQPGAYRCPSCGKLYRWKKNLISHRRLECGKEPQLQCPYCPHRTKHKSSLVKHVDRLHGQPCP
ncbi:hypothetical protein B7P43_G11954 [Cryptotermes secundus]|uniref:C2H2-type domain-containing protein n=1 Tax=Cryptotermes secundus TaxID=105785 RepID=A0A2J7R9S8_9NEOP|nr:hypothetical protein B7P43_G11954 [Cryptotermes secundus]